jgi:hypothetical protein
MPNHERGCRSLLLCERQEVDALDALYVGIISKKVNYTASSRATSPLNATKFATQPP